METNDSWGALGGWKAQRIFPAGNLIFLPVMSDLRKCQMCSREARRFENHYNAETKEWQRVFLCYQCLVERPPGPPCALCKGTSEIALANLLVSISEGGRAVVEEKPVCLACPPKKGREVVNEAMRRYRGPRLPRDALASLKGVRFLDGVVA
jgi:hypothetical protein